MDIEIFPDNKSIQLYGAKYHSKKANISKTIN